MSYKKTLEKEGPKVVELYRQALTDADRVATGKTNDSIRYEATDDKLTIYSFDHVRDLENGQTASQIQAKNNASLFDQIQEWVEARNIGGSKQFLVSARIYRSLLKNGWNTKLPNRTGKNGGTKGLITDVDKEVKINVLESVKKASKSVILQTIKGEKK